MDISSLLEVEVKEGKPSELDANGEIEAYKNIPDFSIRDIASVRFRKLHCTACDIHIGSAPSEAHNMHEHPVLRVLLCTKCRNFYGDGTFEQGDDATDMFCRWCANGGNLYCCSYCSNTFCYACIKRNFDPLVRKKIERDEKWKCFVCNPADLYSARASCWALLQHVQTVTRILQTDRKMRPEEVETKMNLDESQCCPHKRKRLDTPSDNEDVDVTYTVPKRKRRKILNAKRSKRRHVKLEPVDGVSETSMSDQGPRQRNSKNRQTNDDNCSVQSHNNSGNNSESYNSGNEQSPEDLPLAMRKKTRRLRSGSSNRSTDTERSQTFIQDDDIPPPLLQCDQTMIEGAESLSFGLTSPGTRGLGSLTPKPGITPVPTANLLKRPSVGLSTRGGRDHRIVRSIGGTPILVQKLPHLLPNVSPSSNNVRPSGGLPMVSIPSRNHVVPSSNRINVIQSSLQPAALVRNPGVGFLKQIRPHIVLAQPITNPNVTTNRIATIETPNVINLDSDDEETSRDVETSNETKIQESNDRINELSTATYPVRPDDGFMTILSSTTKNSEDKSTPDEIEQCPKTSLNSFMEAVRGSLEPMDEVIEDLTKELKKHLRWTVIVMPEKEWITVKTKSINRTLERTIIDLRCMNDRIIEACHTYKGELTRKSMNPTPSVTLKKKEKSNKIITLDMHCTRDSDPESDELTSDNEHDDSQDIGPLREMRPQRWRVSRAVEAKPSYENKFVQVDDVVTTDYEKSIGYALLLKADYDSKRERDILKPVKVPDEHFGKYEEEFISYLQYIEDRRNVGNSGTDDDSLAFTSVNDLVEADISIARRVVDETESPMSENESTNVDEKRTRDENVEILDEHLEIAVSTNSLNSLSSDSNARSSDSMNESLVTTLKSKKTRENEILETNVANKTTLKPEEIAMEINANKDETSKTGGIAKDKSRRSAEETILAVKALVDDDPRGNSNGDAASEPCLTIESDDECTVLD